MAQQHNHPSPSRPKPAHRLFLGKQLVYKRELLQCFCWESPMPPTGSLGLHQTHGSVCGYESRRGWGGARWGGRLRVTSSLHPLHPDPPVLHPQHGALPEQVTVSQWPQPGLHCNGAPTA